MGSKSSKKTRQLIDRRKPNQDNAGTDNRRVRKNYPTLPDYFLGNAYKQGEPCNVEGYEEGFYAYDATEIATLRHQNTGIQCWQFALDLRTRTRSVIIEEVFESQDLDNSGYLDKHELKVALQALGFTVTEDELFAATKYHGGLKRTCISHDDFVSLVAQREAEDLCLFVFTDEQRFRSIADPNMKLSHIWTSLVKDEIGELGPGLYATSRPPDQWDNQIAVIINNNWPGENVAIMYGEDSLQPPSSPALKNLIVKSAGKFSAAFCIPVLCGREAASNNCDYMGKGCNAFGEHVLPWRDVWVIDLAWGGLQSKVAALPNRGNGLLADCNGKDALISILRSRIAWRDSRFGHDNVDTASLLDQLARIRSGRNQLSLAVPLFRRAFATREQFLGWGDVRTLASATSLGLLLERTGDLQEAEDVLRRVLTHRTKKFGAAHPDTIGSLGNLALLHRQSGNSSEFGQLFQRCHNLCQNIVSQGRGNALDCLASASPLFLKSGRHEEHARMVREAADIAVQRLLVREQKLLQQF